MRPEAPSGGAPRFGKPDANGVDTPARDAASLRLGLAHEVVGDDRRPARARERALRIAGLGAEAARANKRTLRQIAAGGPSAEQRRDHFTYAPNAEHREGVAASIEKRTPRFHRG